MPCSPDFLSFSPIMLLGADQDKHAGTERDIAGWRAKKREQGMKNRNTKITDLLGGDFQFQIRQTRYCKSHRFIPSECKVYTISICNICIRRSPSAAPSDTVNKPTGSMYSLTSKD